MLIIKAYAGDGAWELHDAERVTFLGQGSLVQIDEGDHSFFDDDRFPDGMDFVHYRTTQDPIDAKDGERKLRFVRWVKWFDPGADECHLLVTDGPVFICNSRGDTIESLR